MTITRISLLAILAFALWCSTAASAADLTIVDNGISPYRIVVALNASVQDYYAAQTLQKYVKEMTGVELPIVVDDNPLTDTEIIVGFNSHTKRVAPNLKPQRFGSEELLIRTVGSRVVIVGGSPRGVIYGVNSLLTEEWGCRWFAPSVTRIPKRDKLVLPETNRRYKPPFEYRESFFWSGLDNEWTVRNFQHGQFAKQTIDQGGRGGYADNWFVHTAMRLVPPETYLKDHPDYYWAQPRKILNVGSDPMGLCLTHPDVIRITAQGLAQSLKDRRYGSRLCSLSAGDSNDWCECPRCLEEYKKIGEKHGQVGNESVKSYPWGVAWWHFAGKVADQLKRVPQVDRPMVGMLAYGYSPLPPTVPERRKDVNVMYAELKDCMFDGIDDPNCPKAKETRSVLKGWLANSDSVYVWLYKLNFGESWFWPHPNMDVFAQELRYLRDAGVKGVFAEGNLYKGDHWDGEFHELRAYMIARLQWNPDLDWREVRREFCGAYYGEAAGAEMERYMDDVRACAVKSGRHHRADAQEKEAFDWATPDAIARWYSILDAAESKAVDDEHKRYVKISRLHVQFTEGMLTKDADKRKDLLRKFADDSKPLGVYYIGGPARWLHEWRTREALD